MQVAEIGQRRLHELIAQLSTEALVEWPVRLVRLDSDGLPDAVLLCDPATGRREVARLHRGATAGPPPPEAAAAEGSAG